jgi:putative peptidoglycan lipid II flippase
MVRVGLTTVLGFLCAIPLPRLLGVTLRWGVVGLTASAGLSAWVEFALLRRSLAARIGPARFASGYLAKLWAAALTAGAAGWGVWLAVGRLGPVPAAAAVLVPYAALYGALTLVLDIPTAHALLAQARHRA